jgi:hypothetical protein
MTAVVSASSQSSPAPVIIFTASPLFKSMIVSPKSQIAANIRPQMLFVKDQNHTTEVAVPPHHHFPPPWLANRQPAKVVGGGGGGDTMGFVRRWVVCRFRDGAATTGLIQVGVIRCSLFSGPTGRRTKM